MKRPPALYLLLLLHVLLALAACYGSILMMLYPDGSGLGMSTDWLKDSPFPDFRIPGIVLFFLGFILPLWTVWGLWTKSKHRIANKLNLYKDRHWSWCFSLYTGVGIQIWIIVQQLLTDYFILQPVIFCVGLSIVLATLWPSVMKNSSMPS